MKFDAGEEVKPCKRHRWCNRGIVAVKIKFSPTSTRHTVREYMKQECAKCPATREVKW